MTEHAFPIPNQSDQGGPYSADDLAQFVKVMTDGLAAEHGIYRGVLDAFEATVDSGNVSVASGVGVFKGFLYSNDAAATLTPTTPSTGTTGFRAVIRISWDTPEAGQIDIEAALSESADGTADIPDLVQTIGTTWEAPLASFTITTGGVITLVDDDRVFHPRTPSTRRMPDYQLVAYAEIDDDEETLGNAVNVVSAEGYDSDTGWRELLVTFSEPVDMVRLNVAAFATYDDVLDGGEAQVVRYWSDSALVTQVFGFKKWVVEVSS